MPSFNVQGDTAINTGFGGCLSIVIMILTLVYALLKFNTLYTRQDPTIYSETFKDSTDMMRMKETDIVMAFALESYQHKELKEDPRYIRTIAYTYVKHSDGRKEYYPITMHKCTEDDWKKFHEIERKSEEDFERIREADGWMCIDWSNDRLKLFDGYEDGTEVMQHIAINWTPCNVIYEDAGYTPETIHDDCIADLDQ